MNPSVPGAERDQPESEANRITFNLKENCFLFIVQLSERWNTKKCFFTFFSSDRVPDYFMNNLQCIIHILSSIDASIARDSIVFFYSFLSFLAGTTTA